MLTATASKGPERKKHMDKTRLLVVDDEALFRELLCRTLSSEPELAVVGVAGDGETAVQLARKEKPDVVIMDIELPGKLDGIEAALQIKKERPQTGIVVLSAHSERRYVTSLPLEDIQGWAYLLKQTAPDLATVVRAIEGSKAGMVVLDPTVVAGLRPRQGSAVARLNPRHQEVLELLAQGYSNAAIAQLLKLSRKSVETYINAIYQELHLSHEQDIHARVKATLLYLESSRSRQG
jgi:DNA-binding NarL/FixJ family response regulator